MPFDDPAFFRLDRIPVRPLHWLWRPYRTCGKLALLDGEAGAVNSPLAARVLHADAEADQTAPRRRRPAGRKDDRAIWQWSNSTLPHGAPRRPWG